MNSNHEFFMKFNVNNAAFEHRAEEISRILRVIADDIESGNEYSNIHDINGNTIGRWLIDDD